MNDPSYATETQKLIKHDPGFRTFLKSRPSSANTTAANFKNLNKSASIYTADKMERFSKIIKQFNKQ